MGMTDTQQQTKILNQLASIKAEHLRLGDQLLELEKLLTLNPTTGQQVKQLFEFWHAQWGLIYKRPYVFAHAKDAASFKRLLKDLSIDEVRARMVRYLKDPDGFFQMQQHPLGLFVAQINRFTGSSFDRADRPVGCTHEPACDSDVTHTRRLMQDRRATR